MGTGYRSAFDFDQNQTSFTIDTDEHPGFYIISLIQNGSILTTRYINAGKIPMHHHVISDKANIGWGDIIRITLSLFRYR